MTSIIEMMGGWSSPFTTETTSLLKSILTIIHYLVIIIVILPIFLTKNRTILNIGFALSVIILLNWLIYDKCLLTMMETQVEKTKYEGFIFKHLKSFFKGSITEDRFNLFLRILLAILISSYCIKLGYW